MPLEIIGTGLLMMFLSTVIHALFMIGGNHALEWRLTRFGPARHHFDKAFLVSLLTIWMYNPLITTLPDLETAFYFSMVTFTTLGYGDVVLSGEWRTLASIQAANGVIIFGWTTALIFYFIQRIYKKH